MHICLKDLNNTQKVMSRMNSKLFFFLNGMRNARVWPNLKSNIIEFDFMLSVLSVLKKVERLKNNIFASEHQLILFHVYLRAAILKTLSKIFAARSQKNRLHLKSKLSLEIRNKNTEDVSAFALLGPFACPKIYWILSVFSNPLRNQCFIEYQSYLRNV